MTNNKTILRFLTSGNVDDGKSTFLGRLLYDSDAIYDDQLRDARTGEEIDFSLLLDGLEDEREQKITIDVAYRYFNSNKRKFIVADAPGHEEYTANMAVAAANSDLAILLIDISKGIKAQTIRHFYIASLYGIKDFIIAINKLDLVKFSEAEFLKLKTEFHNETLGLFPEVNFNYVPIASKSGDNIVRKGSNMPWYDGKTIIELLESIEPKTDAADSTRYLVQYVSKTDEGRILRGKLLAGELQVGDEVIVSPGNKRAKVKNIIDEGDDKIIRAGQSSALILDQEYDISRGYIIAKDDNLPQVADHFFSYITWFGKENFDPNKQYLVKLNHNWLRARFAKPDFLIDAARHNDNYELSDLKANNIFYTKVEIEREVAFDLFYQGQVSGAFLISDPYSNESLGCGIISDAKQTARADNSGIDGDLAAFVQEVKQLGEKHFGVDKQELINNLLTNFEVTNENRK